MRVQVKKNRVIIGSCEISTFGIRKRSAKKIAKIVSKGVNTGLDFRRVSSKLEKELGVGVACEPEGVFAMRVWRAVKELG